MTDVAKVMLSEFEAMLVTNTEWILTKHTIIQKAAEMLSSQVDVINNNFMISAASAFPELTACVPKISKGEKYRELPYVILDYPAIFSKSDVFALRTMFWWGHFISVTLQLSGKYKKQSEAFIEKNLPGANPSLYISSGNEAWQHHFEADNYTLLSLMDAATLHKKIVQPSFIKIALKYDLNEWNNMDVLLKEAYSSLAVLLKS